MLVAIRSKKTNPGNDLASDTRTRGDSRVVAVNVGNPGPALVYLIQRIVSAMFDRE
jgi:hypothetical protein